MRVLFLAFTLIFCSAMIPVEQTSKEKKNVYHENGVFIGGVSKGPVVLVNVRHILRNDRKQEKFIFDLNSLGEESSSPRPGYYQVSIQKNPRRILVDLQDVYDTKVLGSQVNELVKASTFVSKAAFYFDAFKKDLTIEFTLKDRVRLEVFEQTVPESRGSIILDVIEP